MPYEKPLTLRRLEAVAQINHASLRFHPTHCRVTIEAVRAWIYQVPLQCSFDTLSEAITQTHAGELAGALRELMAMCDALESDGDRVVLNKARAVLAKFKEIAG